MRGSLRFIVLADVAMASAANMVTAIALARAYSDYEFASFGIGLTIALVLQSVQRIGFINPLTILSANRARVLRRIILGEHLLVISIIGLLFAVVVVALGATGFLDAFARLIAI